MVFAYKLPLRFACPLRVLTLNLRNSSIKPEKKQRQKPLYAFTFMTRATREKSCVVGAEVRAKN